MVEQEPIRIGGEGRELVFCGTPQLRRAHAGGADRGGTRDRAGGFAARPARGPHAGIHGSAGEADRAGRRAMPSRSRKRSATTQSFARSLRRLRRTRLWWWRTGASFRRGCWRCRGWAASICTLRCCRSIAAPRRFSGRSPWAKPSPATPRCCWKKGLDTGPILLQQRSADRAGTDSGGSVSRSGAARRAAGGGDAGGPGRRHDSTAAAGPRARHACADSRPRRRAHGFCRAHGDGTEEPLARISAVAGSVHAARWQEADRASHGGGCSGRAAHGDAADPGELSWISGLAGRAARRVRGWS